MTPDQGKIGHNRLLLLVAGLGGLLYGIDIGIIAGALPYLEVTSGLGASQLSMIVAAVLLGSVISTLFAGMLADWMGRKPLMTISGVLFVLSIPIIALADGYWPLLVGRLLQGISAGLIGVVVPLYLAESLAASSRGRGTGIFQWMLTSGIVAAALIGMYFSIRVEEVARTEDADQVFAFKDQAWRSIFWVSLPPGLLFMMGSLMVVESPRWLFRRGRIDAARVALLQSRSVEQAAVELKEMEQVAAIEGIHAALETCDKSLLQRRYVIPFLLACIILACTQATGVASVISFNIPILVQAGLSDLQAHWGYVILTATNFVMTVVGVVLVDRKGRTFLLSLGSAGIIVSLVCAGVLFLKTETQRMECRDAIQRMVTEDQRLVLPFDPDTVAKLQSAQDNALTAINTDKARNLIVIYSYGGFRTATKVVRSDDRSGKPIAVSRHDSIPGNKVVAFFTNPFADLDDARKAPLRIENALLSQVPDTGNGWLVASCLFAFMAFFAVGPGICVWLALSELLPTRIRSNGMSIALLINQAVSTTIAAIFLPTVGKYGYSTMFFVWAGCTAIYFVTAFWFLPETKGKTLEEIESHFCRSPRPPRQ